MLAWVVGVVLAIAFEAIAVGTAMPAVARELDGYRSSGSRSRCSSPRAWSGWCSRGWCRPARPGPAVRPGHAAVVAAAGWLVAGLGMGLGVTSLSVLLLEASPPAEHGANSASLQVSDSLGSIVMIGIAGAGFGGLHGRGHDGLVFLGIYGLTATLAALGAVVGRRATPADHPV